ncbi:MAG: phosphoglycerate mutase family protein [archaeon]
MPHLQQGNKTISFGNKRHVVSITNTFQRHSEREHIKNAVRHHLVKLTPQGKIKAREIGKNLPKDRTLKIYFSPSIRTKQTAHYLYRGHNEAGGSAARYFSKGTKGNLGSKRVGEREELMGKHLFRDEKRVQEEYSKVGRDNAKMVRNWIDGDYKDITLSPKIISKDIAKSRVVLGQRAAGMGVKGYQIMNIGHDWQIMALFEFLTKKKFTNIGVTMPLPNEGFTIHHTASGRAILEYQGQKFDVTRALKKARKF